MDTKLEKKLGKQLLLRAKEIAMYKQKLKAYKEELSACRKELRRLRKKNQYDSKHIDKYRLDRKRPAGLLEEAAIKPPVE
jgi:hypothetical protein